MLPEATHENLIYANDNDHSAYVFTYPKGKLVGTISGLTAAYGECSDANGNVFITNSYGPEVYEYAHGHARRIATLSVSGYYVQSCGVDPTTGNLAVCAVGNDQAVAAVFAGEQGTPTLYPSATGGRFCTYDSRGNLFMDGDSASNFHLDELPAGGTAFEELKIANAKIKYPGSLQWDGQALALNVPKGAGTRGPAVIYRIQVSGSIATVIGKTRLRTIPKNHDSGIDCQYWVQGNAVLAGHFEVDGLGVWRYPKGGEERETIATTFEPCGITVSVAPNN